MRKIEKIIVHCSATKAGQHFTVEDIDAWHRVRGFRSIGYHWVVYLDGSVHAGRPEAEAGAHCKGQNGRSIGVCYIGGLDAKARPCDTRTAAQRRYPGATVHGHNEFAAKACPCFPISAL